MNTVITAAQVLPTPNSPLRDGAVLVTDDRITAVGPRAQVLEQAGPSATRYDYPDATVLAGLFNAHVHLVFDASPDFIDRMQRATREELQVGAVDRLRQLVRAGVTTVRDLGDRDQLAVSVRSAGVVLPRVLAAGTPLTVPGGHCHFLGGAVASDSAARDLIDANAAAGRGRDQGNGQRRPDHPRRRTDVGVAVLGGTAANDRVARGFAWPAGSRTRPWRRRHRSLRRGRRVHDRTLHVDGRPRPDRTARRSGETHGRPGYRGLFHEQPELAGNGRANGPGRRRPRVRPAALDGGPGRAP